MYEELSIHEEERRVMDCPYKDEETSRIPQTIADGCSQNSRSDRNMTHVTLTFRYSFGAPPSSQDIRTDDTNIDRQRNNTCPPPDKITNQVNLLLGGVLRPEADSTQEERPVDGTARVWVGCSKSRIVLYHQ